MWLKALLAAVSVRNALVVTDGRLSDRRGRRTSRLEPSFAMSPAHGDRSRCRARLTTSQCCLFVDGCSEMFVNASIAPRVVDPVGGPVLVDGIVISGLQDRESQSPPVTYTRRCSSSDRSPGSGPFVLNGETSTDSPLDDYNLHRDPLPYSQVCVIGSNRHRVIAVSRCLIQERPINGLATLAPGRSAGATRKPAGRRK